MSRCAACSAGRRGRARRPRSSTFERDLARAHTVEALETLIEVMRDEAAPPTARIAAAAHLLDRGYGKPVATVDAVVRGAKNLSDAELLAILGQTADEPAETEH